MIQTRVSIVFALLFVSLCPAPLVSAQETPTTGSANKSATSSPMVKHLEFKRMSLEDAVVILMKKIGENYALDCGLQDAIIRPLTIDNMEQEDAVRLLVKASGRSVSCFPDEQHNIRGVGSNRRICGCSQTTELQSGGRRLFYYREAEIRSAAAGTLISCRL